MRVLELSDKQKKYLRDRKLGEKYKKQVGLLEKDIRHPGLNVELLEPRERGFYSFRIDKQYRAIFIFNGKDVEVLLITNHYK